MADENRPNTGLVPAVMTASSLDAPRRVVDLTTGLPSLTSLFRDLRPVIERPSGATIFYIHLAANRIIEERFGWEALEAYLVLVNNFLERLRQQLRLEREHCVVARAYADDYVIVVPQNDHDENFAHQIAERMNRHINAMDADLSALHQVYLGTTAITPFAKIHPERLIYRGIQDAQTEATDVGRQRVSLQTRILDRCIAQQNSFSIVYQPLVSLAENRIYAYEALARCSQQELRNPHVLFNVAEQGDRIWPLSRLLRRLAVLPIDTMPEGAHLFLNLHPSDFDDPELLQPEPFLVSNAKRIVIEVTERAAISDFAEFRRKMDHLRRHGIRIAIDDLGSGYAALSSAAELDPDFIKFDMTLIRDIDQSPIRQNLLRNMISFATRLRSPSRR